MAQGASREQWNHTSSLLALLANCHRDPKKGRARKPADFHPQSKRTQRKPLPTADITILKSVFIDRPRG